MAVLSVGPETCNARERAYARACSRHRVRATGSAVVFFLVVIAAVLTSPRWASTPHHPTVDGLR